MKMNSKLIILTLTFTILQQVLSVPLIGRDLATDVAAARSECVQLELRSDQFRSRIEVFKAEVQGEVANTGDTIVQKLRDAGLATIEADRIQLLMDNCVVVSDSTANAVNADLTNIDNNLNTIIERLDTDLGQLGQADRDLRAALVRVNGTFVDGEAEIRSNFDVTMYSVLEAANTVDFQTNVDVNILWQHIDDVMMQQYEIIIEQKNLLDGVGNLAVNALDVVIDQLP